MTYDVVCLPGDGIGPEVMNEGLKVLRAVADVLRIDFRFEEIACGGKYFLDHGRHRDWPDGSEKKCAAADMILLGAVGWPDPDGNGPTLMENGHMAGHSAVLGNRMRLDLYANVRPVRLYPGVHHRIHGKSRHVWEPSQVDIIFVRENTEGLYSPTGGILAPGNVAQVGIDTRVITRRGSERVIRRAFEICQRKKRGAPADGKKRVTCIVKDNVLHGCRVFRDIFFEIGKEFPDIEKETAIVDAFTQWLVTKPEGYDVCVTTNMFGDIVTDLASVLQGGMGMAAGANIGDEHAMFEPIHGSAPKYSGLDKANPMAMILTVHEGLLWLADKKSDPKLEKAADAIERAVMKILERGSPLTYDLVEEPSKAAKCSVVGTAVAEEARKLAAAGTPPPQPRPAGGAGDPGPASGPTASAASGRLRLRRVSMVGEALRPLPRRFYARSALTLAPDLLGKLLVVRSPAGLAAGRIVEVEAYCGPADRAAHTSGGRRTPRNEVMWGAPGHLYVYFVYGMHWCANVVAAPAGCPEAVLLRALEPVDGLELMRKRRGSIPDRNLARGPANLCQALGITGSMNGADLVSADAFLAKGALARGERIARTTRIGVDYAGTDAQKPWRFLIAESRWVSKPPPRA